MLISERQTLILQLLDEQNSMSVQQLMDATDSSESTIRRDLTELERLRKLDRIHGGATLRDLSATEKTYDEKSIEQLNEKQKIAAYAASLVQDGDCIFLDAGTTAYQMIPHLANKQIIVVTNSLTHLSLLHQFAVKTYVIGGLLKNNTQAFVGANATMALKQYHFDKCFIGVNGFDEVAGYTTADPEEASVKAQAIQQATQAYALADFSKFKILKFSKIASIEAATLLTDGPVQSLQAFLERTEVVCI